ncbi:hypothetical protein BTVI_136935 [Pitangus sulphuratus]|nr:hypothetical protein BTVI_136935 [Pitangus sulphuratus]
MTTMKGSCLFSLLLAGLGVLGMLEPTTTEDMHCHRAEHPIIAYKEIAPWLHVFKAKDAVDFSQLTFDPGQKELIAGARQNAVLQAAQDDLGQLRTQLVEAHAEMENIKAIAKVSETTKEEATDEVKRQWQEEITSLQAIMKETVHDYEVEYHHRVDMVTV